jgi:hypothetical protein
MAADYEIGVLLLSEIVRIPGGVDEIWPLPQIGRRPR